ncbi:hypothetical protein FKP32DRAFT_1467449 [Trametes sanguinea]|nr:hypothetical protein FKP32DRAFT_1467449 [Trametes sanguinea]
MAGAHYIIVNAQNGSHHSEQRSSSRVIGFDEQSVHSSHCASGGAMETIASPGEEEATLHGTVGFGRKGEETSMRERERDQLRRGVVVVIIIVVVVAVVSTTISQAALREDLRMYRNAAPLSWSREAFRRGAGGWTAHRDISKTSLTGRGAEAKTGLSKSLSRGSATDAGRECTRAPPPAAHCARSIAKYRERARLLDLTSYGLADGAGCVCVCARGPVGRGGLALLH